MISKDANANIKASSCLDVLSFQRQQLSQQQQQQLTTTRATKRMYSSASTSASASERFLLNELSDYRESNKGISFFPLSKHNKELLSSARELTIKSILQRPYRELKRDEDYSVYSGVSGLSLTFLQLYKNNNDPQYLEISKEYIQLALSFIRPKKRQEISFLVGVSGVYSIAAVIFEDSPEIVYSYLEKLLSLEDEAIGNVGDSCELLYGRAGYLHALYFVLKNCKHLGDFLIPICSAYQKVFYAIIKDGETLSKKLSENLVQPLVFEWYESRYLGFAHGYAGILYFLMDVYENELFNPKKFDRAKETIKKTLDAICGNVFPSGNFPSSEGKSRDELVQWCHGSPGLILTLCKAYKIFKEEKYLELANRGASVVWERGILRKGFGLCHGLSGNTFPLLTLYKLTKDEKHLWRSLQFSLFGSKHLSNPHTDEAKSLIFKPDTPYSLFEGLSGLLWLIDDFLKMDECSKNEPKPSLDLFTFPTL